MILKKNEYNKCASWKIIDKINGKIKDFGFYTGFSVNKIDLKF